MIRLYNVRRKKIVQQKGENRQAKHDRYVEAKQLYYS